MIIALWIINALLALAFLGAGAMKLARSREALIAGGQGYFEDFSDGTVKAIGVVEVLGALGLILPLATGIVPILTPIAAVGLAVAMLVATIVHLRRKDKPTASLALMVLAAISAVLGFIVLT